MNACGLKQRVGVVAGYGQFPALFAQAAKKRGMEVYALAWEKQADPGLHAHVDVIERAYLGELAKVTNFFKQHGVRRVCFLGGVKKSQMFEDIRLDKAALELLSGLDSTRDDAVMRAFAGALENEGLRVEASTWLLPELLAPAGCWTRRKPTKQEMQDVELGFKLAKKIGELDIGQCLVVARGSVIAVEAMEGTDAAILRAGTLCPSGAVVVKIKKPGQDERFDLPAAGVETIRSMEKANASVLCLEAGASVVFDRQDMIRRADDAGICVLAINDMGCDFISLY